MAADHTLTLIFDSDEEIHNDTIPGGSGSIGESKGHEQKRLSEIVEDYLDEGNLTPTNLQNQKKNSTSQKSHSNLLNNDSSQLNFGTGIDSQPF